MLLMAIVPCSIGAEYIHDYIKHDVGEFEFIDTIIPISKEGTEDENKDKFAYHIVKLDNTLYVPPSDGWVYDGSVIAQEPELVKSNKYWICSIYVP